MSTAAAWVRENEGKASCHSLISSLPVIICSLIISSWQLIAFYYTLNTNNPGESPPLTRTETYTDTAYQRKMSVDVWQLRSSQDHSTTLSFCQKKQKESVWFLMQSGEEEGFGGWRGTAVKFINSSDLPVKASHFFPPRLNINKHNHVQMSPNEMWQFYWA